MWAFHPPTSLPTELLCLNLRLNLVPNVRAREVAVTGVSGRAALDVSSVEAVRHHVVAGATGPSTREVAAMTLAEVLDERDVPTCDFLKIDCEDWRVRGAAGGQPGNAWPHLTSLPRVSRRSLGHT